MKPIFLKIVMMVFFLVGFSLFEAGSAWGIPLLLVGGGVLWVFSVAWLLVFISILLLFNQKRKLRRLKKDHPRTFHNRSKKADIVDYVTDVAFVIVCGAFYHLPTAIAVLIGYGFSKHSCIREMKRI